jgi:hypothetical protein
LEVIDPLVPVIVNVYARLDEKIEVVTVSTEDPEPLIDDGLNVPFPPDGNPLTESATVPANPAPGVSVTVKVVDSPPITDWELGVTVIENVPVITRVTVTVLLKLPLVPVITRG